MSQESETAGLYYELIIVDDGSMDGTLGVGSDYDITKKEGIIKLEKGQTYCATHTITVLQT